MADTTWGRDKGLDPGLNEGCVERLADFRQVGDRLEFPLVLDAVAAQGPNVLEAAFLDPHVVVALQEFPTGFALALVGDHDLIEPRREAVDQVHVVDELRMLLGRDLGAHEDREMSRGFVQAIENRLAVLADLIDTVVVVEDPVERLLGGRDVVALRAEAEDRRLDVAHVEPDPVPGHDLRRRELVADKEVIDDVVAAPRRGSARRRPTTSRTGGSGPSPFPARPRRCTASSKACWRG